ncbi:hypothetical protein DFH09DRAFT_1336512 [Mycena vulgaris]|nr:hypothetical protein DFH09DRAFT_1336512 [Mycena vulgaris]
MPRQSRHFYPAHVTRNHHHLLSMLSTPRSRPSPKWPALSGSASFKSSSTVFSDASYRHRHLRAPRDGPGSRRPPWSPIARAKLPSSSAPRGSHSPFTSIHSLFFSSSPSVFCTFFHRTLFVLPGRPAIASSNVPLVASLTMAPLHRLYPTSSPSTPVPALRVHIHPHCIAFPPSFLRAPHSSSSPSCVLARHRSLTPHPPSIPHTFPSRIHGSSLLVLAASPSLPLRILIILPPPQPSAHPLPVLSRPFALPSPLVPVRALVSARSLPPIAIFKSSALDSHSRTSNPRIRNSTFLIPAYLDSSLDSPPAQIQTSTPRARAAASSPAPDPDPDLDRI